MKSNLPIKCLDFVYMVAKRVLSSQLCVLEILHVLFDGRKMDWAQNTMADDEKLKMLQSHHMHRAYIETACGCLGLNKQNLIIEGYA